MPPPQVYGQIEDIENIAIGTSIDVYQRLVETYGRGRWFKRKGVAYVDLPDAKIVRAEVHWYEAHGIGRKELKIKRLLD